MKKDINYNPLVAEEGSIPATFRLQKNLIKLMDLYSDNHRLSKTDLITYAVYQFIKDEFNENIEPFKNFEIDNKKSIERFLDEINELKKIRG